MSTPRVGELRGLLEQLESQWRRMRAPIADRLAPGLSEDRMDALTAPLGLTLPAEIKAFFAWHDGVIDPVYGDDAGIDQENRMGPSMVPRSLRRQVQACQVQRDWIEEWHRDNPPDPDYVLWEPSWFPVIGPVGARRILAVDCHRDPDLPALAAAVTKEETYPPDDPAFTFTDVIAFWVHNLSIDAYRWNQERHLWDEGSRPVEVPDPTSETSTRFSQFLA